MDSLENAMRIMIEGMWKQNKPSLGENGCAYRGNGGCKCPAGFLIEDDEYLPFMEGKGIKGLLKLCEEACHPLKAFKGFSDYEVFIVDLFQSAHDNVARGFYRGQRTHSGNTFFTDFLICLAQICKYQVPVFLKEEDNIKIRAISLEYLVKERVSE